MWNLKNVLPTEGRKHFFKNIWKNVHIMLAARHSADFVFYSSASSCRSGMSFWDVLWHGIRPNLYFIVVYLIVEVMLIQKVKSQS